MQPALDQVLERYPVMLGDRGEADMGFVLVVLGADVESGSLFRQRAQPVLARDVGDVADSDDCGRGFRLNAATRSDRRRPPVPTKTAGVSLPA